MSLTHLQCRTVLFTVAQMNQKIFDSCQKKFEPCTYEDMLPTTLTMPSTLAHHSCFLADSLTLYSIGYFSRKSCLLAQLAQIDPDKIIDYYRQHFIGHFPAKR